MYIAPSRIGAQWNLNNLDSTTTVLKMHPCLTIVEVQYAIFRQAHLECGSPPALAGKDNATLARLAYTCRSFSDAALNVLWERLASITCLIRCLPSSLWKVESHAMSAHRQPITFQRTMTPNDWEIFCRYASRVRSLSDIDVRGNIFFTLDNSVILALSRPPFNGPLIPRLKVLRWMRSKENVPLLPVLFTPTLVDITLPPVRYLHSQSPKILFQLISTCLSLETLCISSDESFASCNEQDQKALSETVMRLKSPLKSLECHTLDEAAVLYVSHLPSLTKLTLDLHKLDLETLRSGLIPPAFASLQSLALRVYELSTLSSVLAIMHFKPRQVSFIVIKGTPTPGQLHSFFNALVSACDPVQLSTVTLEGGSSDFDLEPLPDADRAQVSLSTFRPLLALRNLNYFKFEMACNISLDDEAIKTLANAWPKLTHLSLNPVLGWGIESRVTHHGLVALFSRCAALDGLALAADFTEIDRPLSSIPRSYGITNPCRWADFITSEIHHPPAISTFLKDICPKLSWTSR